MPCYKDDPHATVAAATVNIKAGPDIPSDANATCTLRVMFGNVVGSPPQFFVDHQVQAVETFPVSQKSAEVGAYYTQVPSDVGTAKMRIAIDCNSGSYHAASVVRPVRALASGPLPVTFDVRL